MKKLNGQGEKILFLHVLFFSCFCLFGRDVKIAVEDADLSIPLEGALIRSWDGTEYFSDEDGFVIIDAPGDRQVTIRASYPGYENGVLIIPPAAESLILGMHLSGVLEGRELVIEAQRPGVSETRSGRSVAIFGETLEQSSQIGLIEDVMTSIKLLPGVGYAGMFNALPSIRGGVPGDMMAVLDGFYLDNPYHWGGGFSIFDPQMTASAQLSHGVFSARYGHTISGLLEVTSKKADPVSASLELGISTSALNLNLAVPLGERGGLMMMGKLTYWDPFIWALKQLSTVTDWEQLDLINAVTTAPYIRSSEISANYRFNADLEWTAAAFIGVDGVGANYRNTINEPYLEYSSQMIFNWDNLQAFFITALAWNPRPDMILKTAAGAGISQAKVNGIIDYDELKAFETDNNGNRVDTLRYKIDSDYLDLTYRETDTIFNIQGKADFDWEPASGFLLAAGVQELFNQYNINWEGRAIGEFRVDIPKYLNNPQYLSPFYYVQFPIRDSDPNVNSQRYNSSAYVLGEYTSPENRFGAELGLRVDHLYLRGKDFDIQTMPVFNPRLNLDFNVFKNHGVVESLDFTLGTGFFSSVSEAIAALSINKDMDDFTLKPNRSWTSVAGIKIDFAEGWTFNLEGYFKYVFDRAYRYSVVNSGGNEPVPVYRFNGDGIIWGFDAMLQKFESRYFDGWLSYTFTHARYHEPERPARGLDSNTSTVIQESPWYYPSFHRFHNINLVLNFKPARNFNIYTRIGFASGRPKAKVGAIDTYPLELWDEGEYPNGTLKEVITTYRRPSWYDENERTTWSIPWDLKLSYFISNNRNKVLTEIYLAAENLTSLFYNSKANTSFNQYTGQEDTGSDSANYEMPVPMVSFGMRWSF